MGKAWRRFLRVMGQFEPLSKQARTLSGEFVFATVVVLRELLGLSHANRDLQPNVTDHTTRPNQPLLGVDLPPNRNDHGRGAQRKSSTLLEYCGSKHWITF